MVIWDKSQGSSWTDLSITTGRYIFDFEIPVGKTAPVGIDKSISIGGKTFQVEKAYCEQNHFYIVLNITQNPWPVALILATLIAGFTYLSLVKIEKLSDHFAEIIIILLIGAYLYLKSSGQSWKLS